jgi:hypothetical protein
MTEGGREQENFWWIFSRLLSPLLLTPIPPAPEGRK